MIRIEFTSTRSPILVVIILENRAKSQGKARVTSGQEKFPRASRKMRAIIEHEIKKESETPFIALWRTNLDVYASTAEIPLIGLLFHAKIERAVFAVIPKSTKFIRNSGRYLVKTVPN